MEFPLIIFIVLLLISGLIMVVAVSLHFCACVKTCQRIHQEKILRRQMEQAAAQPPPPYSVVVAVAPCRIRNCNCQCHNHSSPPIEQQSGSLRSANERHLCDRPNSPCRDSRIVNICMEASSHQNCPANSYNAGQELILTSTSCDICTCVNNDYENNAFYANSMEECGCCPAEPPPPTYEEALEKERKDSLCQQLSFSH